MNTEDNQISCNIPNLINRGIIIKRGLLLEFNWKYFYLLEIENYDISMRIAIGKRLRRTKW
jgi:hypothetical protein